MIFSDYVRILRRFLWLVLVAAVLGAGVAYVALTTPETQYQAKFSVALAPNTTDAGTYGNLIDALDRRSIPSTFAQVVMSPSVKDAAATDGRVSHRGMTIKAVVVTDSNVVDATITGPNAARDRDYAAALINSATTTFSRLYPLYLLTPLRQPATAEEVPRHLATGLLLGGISGALLAYLLALGIDANRRARGRARLEPASIAPQATRSGGS
jgi:hypothetical protein